MEKTIIFLIFIIPILVVAVVLLFVAIIIYCLFVFFGQSQREFYPLTERLVIFLLLSFSSTPSAIE